MFRRNFHAILLNFDGNPRWLPEVGVFCRNFRNLIQNILISRNVLTWEFSQNLDGNIIVYSSRFTGWGKLRTVMSVFRGTKNTGRPKLRSKAASDAEDAANSATRQAALARKASTQTVDQSKAEKIKVSKESGHAASGESGFVRTRYRYACFCPALETLTTYVQVMRTGFPVYMSNAQICRSLWYWC